MKAIMAVQKEMADAVAKLKPAIQLLRVEKGTKATVQFINDFSQAEVVLCHRSKNHGLSLCLEAAFKKECPFHDFGAEIKSVKPIRVWTIWNLDEKQLQMLRVPSTRLSEMVDLVAITAKRGTLIGFDIVIANQPDEVKIGGRKVLVKRRSATDLKLRSKIPSSLKPFTRDEILQALAIIMRKKRKKK